MFRYWLRNTMPSMFQRRLVLLLCVCVLAVLAMGWRTLRLTTGESHRNAINEAEQNLVTSAYIPTIRGRIYDRTGHRILAMDEPGYDIAVDYDVIDGGWAYKQARRQAYRENREMWSGLSAEEQHRLAEECRPPFDQQVDMLWQTLANITGTPRADLDQRLNAIRKGVAHDASYLWHRWRQDESRKLGAVVPLADVALPIRAEQASHWVVADVNDAARSVIADFIAQAEQPPIHGEPDPMLAIWEHVHLEKPRRRRYPLETMTVMLDTAGLPTPLREKFHSQPTEVSVQGVGLNILGLMRDAWKEDVRQRPFLYKDDADVWQVDLGGYRDGDRVGSFGVEATLEPLLRGTRGKRTLHRDTGGEDRIEPAAGHDVQLTIDIALQARLQAILSDQIGLTTRQPWHTQSGAKKLVNPPRDGDKLQAAAVVIDVDTSEILAAATHPSMSIADLRDRPAQIYNDQLNRPFLDRAFGFALQPGSTIKPLVLVSAVAAGKYKVGDTITCNGVLDPNHPNQFRCWIYKSYLSQHGPLTGRQAIEHSCNIFFYTLGERMGAKTLVTWLGRFGLGEPTRSGVTGEVGGHLPDLADAGLPNKGFEHYDAVNMGIGQGPIAWTPIQAANAYATLARGGLYMSPTVIKDPYRAQPRKALDLHLNPQAVESALQGLHDVIHSPHGSGRQLSQLHEPIFNLPGVTILGKTGTAEGSPLRAPIDDDGDGYPDRWSKEVLRDGDHGWLVALVQPDGAKRPKYAIAVVVEYGGSGANCAGPIANQVVYALKAEGYLP